TVSGGDNALFVDNVMVRESPIGPPDPVTLISPEDEAAEQPIDGFDLTWSAAVTGGNPDSYAIFMSQTEANLYTDYYWDNITLTRFDPTQAEINPLTYNYSGTWYWTVQALNGDGDAYQETPFSFTIMDDPRILSLPYSQNFDGVTAPAMPAEWTGYVNSTNTFATAETYSSTTYAVSAPNSVKLYNSSDTAADLRIVTPEITVPMNSIKLSFYARISSTSETLLVGTVDTPEGTFTQLASIDLTTTQTPYTVSLADYVGTDHYICFKHGVTSTSKTIYIDDVQMDQLAANDMAVVSLTGLPYGFENTEATHTVTVKNNGTSTQNSYTVYLKSVDNRIVLASEIINEELLPDATKAVDLSWTPASLGTLDIYGEVVLAGDAVPVNNVSEIMTFNTYEEGILFESFEGGIIPSNWTVLNEDGDTRTWEAATTYPNTGEYAASCRYGDSSSTDNDDWLITPPLQLSSSVADQISFWIGKSSSSTSYTEDWEVLLSSTNTDPSSFTMIDSGTIPDLGYIQKSYDLDTYFSGDAVVYLALRYRGTWDWYLHADDFVGPQVYIPASLPQPVLTISTSGSNVVLDWDAIPYARSYQIKAADAPEGPYTLLTTVTGNTYSTSATSKKFFKVIASNEGIRTINQQPLSLEQQLLKDEADRAANGKE
ncbi:MAG: choice-of-anchor J domain-containing protein, partial [Candidatus Cloacimonetes bacterium]|nr:choice-of-anchor J domain-containing protein [Candidatus Cloacimonadota bacterium]